MEYSSNFSKFKTPQEELDYLKNKVAEKEKELSEKGFVYQTGDAVFDEISRYRDKVTEDVLHTNYKLPEKKVSEIVLNLAPETHDSKMSELIEIIQTKGVKNALDILRAMKDPHLEDDFHRMLVQYIQGDYPVKKMSKEVAKSTKFVLYEIMVQESEDGKQRSLREVFFAMEQFLTGMSSVNTKDNKDNHFTIEIANANGSDQFVFYVSVPVSKKDLFEKQITSLFHTIKISIEPNDYNVFNEQGVSIGTYIKTSEFPVFPIKTGDSFEIDPLNTILNSFSKIDKVGEGAAIQFVIKPIGDFYNKQYKYYSERVEKGEKLKDVISDSILSSFGKTFFDLFFSKSPSEGDKPEEKKTDSDAISAIKSKISSNIFAVNIRLVVSANSRPEAEKIVSEIESSFNQFESVGQNSLKFEKLDDKKQAKLFRDFSFRNFESDIDLPLNTKEIATLIHFPSITFSLQPQLKSSGFISSPAPQDMLKSGVILGKNIYRGQTTDVYMSEDDRVRHLYIIGQTGTGKTTLMKNMIIQDMQNGNGVCYIDPHGSDILDILANVPKDRVDDLIYFDPSYVDRPMALNVMEYDQSHPEQKTFVVNELLSIFKKLYAEGNPEAFGPMFEQYFRNAAMLVVEDPETGNTLLDISRVLANKKFRDLKISRCKNPVVVEFWKEVAEKAGGEASLSNVVPYITSKFDVFMANDVMRPIISQEKSSFNFRDIMDNKKILLVNLAKGKLGDINANLIGLILVGKILMSALSRVDSIEKGFPPFYLYIDEFQNITTNSISTILSEARKYKLSLNIAHQFIAQIPQNIKDAVFGNVGSMVSFRISSEDASYLEKQYSPIFSAKDLMNVENRNALVKMLVNGRPAKPFNIATLPPPKGDPAIVDSLKHLSYLKYGGDREEIEMEINNKYKKTTKSLDDFE